MASLLIEMVSLVCLISLASCLSPPGQDNAPGTYHEINDDGSPGYPIEEAESYNQYGFPTSNQRVDPLRALPPSPPSGPNGRGRVNPQKMGLGCPYEPDQYGRYPEGCYNVITRDCSCKNDDMIFPPEQCLMAFGRESYERRLLTQTEIERKRGSSAEYLERCAQDMEYFLSSK